MLVRGEESWLRAFFEILDSAPRRIIYLVHLCTPTGFADPFQEPCCSMSTSSDFGVTMPFRKRSGGIRISPFAQSFDTKQLASSASEIQSNKPCLQLASDSEALRPSLDQPPHLPPHLPLLTRPRLFSDPPPFAKLPHPAYFGLEGGLEGRRRGGDEEGELGVEGQRTRREVCGADQSEARRRRGRRGDPETWT